MKEYFSRAQTDKAIDYVLKVQKTKGLYAPLLSRMTIYMDDDIPKLTRDSMRKNKHAPMCVSEGLKLNVDRQFVYETINEAFNIYAKKMPIHNMLEVEVQNIFIHELTHTLCQHIQQTINFYQEKNSKGGMSHREQMAFSAACEVEANRGYGIQEECSPVYRISVTDTYTYPKAINAEYLKDIYEVILREYGDELDKDYDDVMKELAKIMSQGEKESNKGENENGQEDNGNGQEGQSGSGKSEGDKGEGDKGKGQSGGSDEGESPTEYGDEERTKRIKAMAQALSGQQMEMNIRKYDENFDADNTKHNDYSGKGNPFGIGGGGIDASGKKPQEVLTEWNNMYRADNIEKSLKRLKGCVKGEVARERVSTYSRQSRKDSSDGLLKKGTKRSARSCPKILVALDCSGSMDGTTTAQATEALAKIFDVTGRPTQGCWICLHDGEVRYTRPFKQWKSVINDFYPAGGNDFSEVVKLANKLNVDVVLNVGDAGDTIKRNSGECKKFRKAGRRWIDIGITKESRMSQGDWVEEVTADDYASTGIIREWEDMTGELEYSTEQVLAHAREKHPEKCKRWAK